MISNDLGIYLHIPFCRKKCNYCGFLSEPIQDDSILGPYVDLLCREIELYGNGRFQAAPSITERSVDTVYFGGGTPSLLSGEQVAKIMDCLRKNFRLKEDAEISLEGNPESFTLEKLTAYKEAGVNRISMGLQAAQCDLLKSLGRIHDLETFRKAYAASREAGFTNVNVDVMFGLPDQTEVMWTETLDTLLTLDPPPEHISTYSLQIEEETPFYTMYKDGEIDLPPYEVDRAMYREAIDKLTAAGYVHYEISNFAKPGYESRHNLKYWNMEDFIGMGLGASSFAAGYRYKDSADLFLWNRLLSMGRLPIMQPETLTPLMVQDAVLVKENLLDGVSTFVFTGLRKREGMYFEDFEDYFGKDFWTFYEEKRSLIDDYIEQGLLLLNDEVLKLTETGIDVSNDIMADLLLEEEEPEQPSPEEMVKGGLPPQF